jgi:hypothetical protein
MVLLYPLIVGIAGYALWRASQGGRDLGGGQGWIWFAVWALVGGGFTFSYLTGFTIGLFILPFVVLLLGVVLWASPRPREALGFVAGIGAMVLVIGFLHWGDRPCPSGGRLHLAVDEYAVSCGGLDPMPWFLAGGVVVGAAVVGYALGRRR